MVVTVGAQRWASCGLIFGGADRDRTGGLLVANQALSQLSYSPTLEGNREGVANKFNSVLHMGQI